MNEHAFLDETKKSGLLMVAAVLAPRSLGRTRAAMRQLCLPGQSRLHFTKESNSRRALIAAAVRDSNVALDIYDATALRDQRQARAACLHRIATDLAAHHVHRLVIEQDDSLLKHDRRVLRGAVASAGATASLAYEHLPARSEPLLWIADAAAWCWTHGPIWQDRIRPAVRHVHRL